MRCKCGQPMTLEPPDMADDEAEPFYWCAVCCIGTFPSEVAW